MSHEWNFYIIQNGWRMKSGTKTDSLKTPLDEIITRFAIFRLFNFHSSCVANNLRTVKMVFQFIFRCRRRKKKKKTWFNEIIFHRFIHCSLRLSFGLSIRVCDIHLFKAGTATSIQNGVLHTHSTLEFFLLLLRFVFFFFFIYTQYFSSIVLVVSLLLFSSSFVLVIVAPLFVYCDEIVSLFIYLSLSFFIRLVTDFNNLFVEKLNELVWLITEGVSECGKSYVIDFVWCKEERCSHIKCKNKCGMRWERQRKRRKISN